MHSQCILATGYKFEKSDTVSGCTKNNVFYTEKHSKVDQSPQVWYIVQMYICGCNQSVFCRTNSAIILYYEMILGIIIWYRLMYCLPSATDDCAM